MKTLKALNLAKSYKGRKVVSDTSMEVCSGEIIGLLGPNGAGKTTSFYMIIGLIRADHGKVYIDNEDITKAPMHVRARKGLGYLPQEASIFRKLTVKDNILAILETRPDLNKAQQEEKALQLMHEFHIGHIADTLGMSLSGGERRRAEIARALAIDPAFILLDEPFAGVDPISVNDIKQIIRNLSERGIGVLVTDHNVRETLDICEKAYIVNEGSILAAGTPDEILNNQQVREVYLGHQFRL
ncbi:MAG: LPS export ABC transporter ATP-binding protein [Gammaproteobacteria bacterium]|nr:LPS export ABC transporter ATP-binding protein [Gammaproteobacteria bacterium]